VRLKFALGRRLLKVIKKVGGKGDWLESYLQQIRMKSVHGADLLEIDWGSTVAYAGNGGEEWISVHINLQERDPFGIVAPEHYNDVREALRNNILEHGIPEVSRVHRAEEIFNISDPRSSLIPDLVVETFNGDVKSDFALGTSAIYEQSKYVKGCHRRAGMFLLAGPDVIQSKGKASLLDIPATVLAWQGIHVPKHFEGRTLCEFITGISEERREEETTMTEVEPVLLSDEEEEGVRKKLESLGYI
jgi:predicted AlkP superfamily phosphohydrolase/phosphomutase